MTAIYVKPIFGSFKDIAANIFHHSHENITGTDENLFKWRPNAF